MKTIKTIAICDLNAAIAAVTARGSGKITNDICLLAQFGMRVLGVPKVESSYRAVYVDTMGDGKEADLEVVHFHAVGKLVMQFDRKEFAKLRRQLPLDVEVEILQRYNS